MDPQAALDLAARAYREDDFEEAFEALNNYFEWRRSGGFEPRGGDKRAHELLDKLVRATGGYESGWEEAEYVEGDENPGGRLVFHAKTRGGKYEIKGFEQGGKYSATEYTSGRETGRSTGHTKSELLRHLAKTIRLAQDIDRINYKVVLDNLGTANPRRKRKTKNPQQRAKNVRSLVAKAMK